MVVNAAGAQLDFATSARVISAGYLARCFCLRLWAVTWCGCGGIRAQPADRSGLDWQFG